MIIGASLTHNDLSKGWLKDWLDINYKKFDKWIIIDDFSNDGTFEYINEFSKDKNIKLIKTNKNIFSEDELYLRESLWNYVREEATENDWILILDSDEIILFDKEDVYELEKYNPNDKIFSLKKIEMWNKDEYRIDGLWSNYFERLFKYQDIDFGYENKKGFHYPCVPEQIYKRNRFNSLLAIQHLGYITEELREEKLNFMINNSQQKKDINYYHLLTVKDKPVLKNIKDFKKLKNILVHLNIVNCYDISKNFKELLLYKKAPFTFFIDIKNSNLKIIDFLKNTDNDKIFFNVLSKYNWNDFRLEYNENRNIFINQYNDIFKNDKNNWDYILFIDTFNDIDFYKLSCMVDMDKNIIYDEYSNILLIKPELLNIKINIESSLQETASLISLKTKEIIWQKPLEMPSPVPFSLFKYRGNENENCNIE